MFSDETWKIPEPIYFSELDEKFASLTSQDYLPIPFLETCAILKKTIDQFPDITYNELTHLYDAVPDKDPLNKYPIDDLASYIGYKTFDLLDDKVKMLVGSNINKRITINHETLKKKQQEIKILKTLCNVMKQSNTNIDNTDSEVNSNDSDSNPDQ